MSTVDPPEVDPEDDEPSTPQRPVTSPEAGAPIGEVLEPIADHVEHEEVVSGELPSSGIRQGDVARELRRPLTERPTVRAGVYAWAFIGLLIMTVVAGLLISQLSIVLIPIVLALFPAAVLQPLSDRLKERRVPDALAAAIVLLGSVGIITAVVSIIAPQFAAQGEVLAAAISDGYDELDSYLASGPFGLQPVRLDDLIDRVTEGFQADEEGGEDGVARGALGFAVRIFETAAATILMFIVLFFYLKDGSRIAEWVRSVFPEALYDDVTIIGRMGWRTIGGYIQGQLLVAFVDAFFIGIGLWILGVELALPLAVITFVGGLFPIVGATIAGVLAALVALATDGFGTALLVIGLVIIVQQVEGNVLQPIIQSRLLSLHPLAIILALAVGGFLLGILGAFLAVPVAAAGAQTVGYLRKRIPG